MPTELKVLWIRFAFSSRDWNRYRRHYSEREIRQILEEGGIAELETLIRAKE